MVGVMKEYSYKNLEHAGRLGNQLFQIAWTYGQAIKNEAIPTVLPSWEYRKFFSIPDSLYLHAGENSIDGGADYYQELRYWDFCSDDIWNFFQPSKIAESMLNTYVEPHKNNMSTIGCSVHHRLGDYLKYPNHFPIPSQNYYLNAISRVLEENSSTIFYIFSDNIPKIKEFYNSHRFTIDLLESNQIVFFEGTPRPVEVSDRKGDPSDWLDLFSMSICHNHIIANSTFSWWAAFLSKTRTAMYPSVWFGQDPAVRHIPWQRMIPADWIKVNAC